MLRPQDTSSAPEGEYLATAGAATRIKASTDPEYHVVQVRGRPYHLPVLQELPRGGKGQGGKSQGGKGGGKGRANNKAHELDLYRTSATVVREVEEMQDPAAALARDGRRDLAAELRAVPDAAMDGRGGGEGEGGKGKGKGEGGGKGKVHDPAAAVKAFNDAIESRGGRGRGGDGGGGGEGKGRGKGEGGKGKGEGGGKGKGEGGGKGKGEGGKGKGEGGKGKGKPPGLG